MFRNEDIKLLQALVRKNLLKNEDISKLDVAEKKSILTTGITNTLIRYLKIDEVALAEIIAEEFNIAFLSSVTGLSHVEIPGLPNDTLPRYRILPIILEKQEMTVAFVDPPSQKHIDQLEKAANLRLVPVIVTYSAFQKLFKSKRKDSKAEGVSKLNLKTIDVVHQGEKWAETADSIPNFPAASDVLTRIIEQALEVDTSDIHFEPTSKGYLNVRFRIDGVLQRIVTFPNVLRSTIPMILKQNATVDAFKKQHIQEGYIKFTIGENKIHARINIIPTNFGDKFTLRILTKSLNVLKLEELGLSQHDINRFKHLLTYPDAIILFVGPAGCGKTTSMYSYLEEMNDDSMNIATVENPIECVIDNINQTTAGSGQKMSYSEGIRALFHHDVDLLALGELRGKDESELLIEAGLTGMIACSTVQASDAIKSLYRIRNLGVNEEDLALVLRGVVGQRFVRKICPDCAEKYRPDSENLKLAGLINLSEDHLFSRGKGCKTCLGTGYLGRIPLFEILLVNDTISSLIHKGSTYEEIKMAAIRFGFTTLKYDGLRKALAGITTLEEVNRVT